MSKSRLIAKLTDAQRKKSRHFFKKHSYLRLPDFFDPEHKNYVRKKLRKAKFFVVDPPRVGRELQMEENPMDHALLFAHNDPELFDLLDQITGCGPLRSYTGRPYRFIPAGKQYDDWHPDTMDRRVLAMSINLSEKPYEGGILMIRDKKTGKIISKVKNTGFGDAIIFKIGKNLEHCLTPVTGKVPKTAYAGWFSRLSNGFLDIQRKNS